jgi:signal transduction histidine kinase
MGVIRLLFAKFNLMTECRKMGIPLWQCPQFLFLIMGALIAMSVTSSLALGRRYIDDPIITLVFIFILTAVLFLISFTITRSFERLAEASRMKSEFINIVSHQLRSPLTSLRWGLNFLVGEYGQKASEKEAGYFQLLKENVQRMVEMVNDLLTVSRADDGRIPFQETEFQFEDVVKDVVLELHASAVAAGVTVVRKGAKVPRLKNDRSLVHHVLANLVDNAIRYAWRAHGIEKQQRARKGNITIRYFNVGTQIRCEVEDNGVGIPVRDQKYIFQKFFRSSNAVRHQTTGTGLGLYIVQALLKRMGGSVGFESEENKGSTFWFTLPIEQHMTVTKHEKNTAH